MFAAAVCPIDHFDAIVDFYKDWTSSDAREWTFSEETTEESGATIRSAFWLSDGAGVALSECGPPGQFDSACITMDEKA